MTKLGRSIAILATVGALVVPAVADFSGTPMAVQLTRISGYYEGVGGEFTLTPGTELNSRVVTNTPSDFSSGTSWQTFCLEKNETVNVPGSYYGDINTFATQGGVGGQDGNMGPNGASSDSLDARTAYLYQNFRMGTLVSGYAYGGTRATDAGDLQNAIWYIEGEVSSISGKAATYYNEAVEATEIGTLYGGGDTDGVVAWSGLSNVRVLNLWSGIDRSQSRQDQLVLTPIPAPGAVLLGAIGLAAVGRLRRRLS